jgi:hypothetical protein
MAVLDWRRSGAFSSIGITEPDRLENWQGRSSDRIADSRVSPAEFLPRNQKHRIEYLSRAARNQDMSGSRRAGGLWREQLFRGLRTRMSNQGAPAVR